MYYVYVLRNDRHNKYYTGCTDDIKKRLKEHNSGKSKYTKNYKLWKIHYFERYLSKREAFAREKYLKSHAGRNWLKKKLLGP